MKKTLLHLHSIKKEIKSEGLKVKAEDGELIKDTEINRPLEIVLGLTGGSGNVMTEKNLKERIR